MPFSFRLAQNNLLVGDIGIAPEEQCGVADRAHAFALGGARERIMQRGAFLAVLAPGKSYFDEFAIREFAVQLGYDAGRRAIAPDEKIVRGSLAEAA